MPLHDRIVVREIQYLREQKVYTDLLPLLSKVWALGNRRKGLVHNKAHSSVQPMAASRYK